jgi:hypothetical protein
VGTALRVTGTESAVSEDPSPRPISTNLIA